MHTEARARTDCWVGRGCERSFTCCNFTNIITSVILGERNGKRFVSFVWLMINKWYVAHFLYALISVIFEALALSSRAPCSIIHSPRFGCIYIFICIYLFIIPHQLSTCSLFGLGCLLALAGILSLPINLNNRRSSLGANQTWRHGSGMGTRQRGLHELLS